MQKKQFKKIYIEITNICNLSCTFCIQTDRFKKYMSVEEFEFIIQQIKPYTDYIYLHVLGEPCMHPDLSKLLEIANNNQIAVNMTTNGILLSKQIQHLIHNVRQVNISLHSFSQHPQLNTAEYIHNCIAYAKELAKHKVYVSLRLWNQKNGCIDEDTKEIVNMLAVGFGCEIVDCNKIKLQDYIYLHFDEVFQWPHSTYPIIDTVGTCYGMQNMCAILVDGSVVPCCLDANAGCHLGNIFQNSFASIIMQERVLQMQQGFQQNKVIEDICQRCGYRSRFIKE